MRWLLAGLIVLCGTSQTRGQPAAPSHTHRTLPERFDEANVTHDGRLTPEQARSKMPAVSRNFAAIDNGQRGYVTVEDIKAYNRTQRAARLAAKGSGSSGAKHDE